MIRLVQLQHPTEGRRVAVVDELYLRIVSPARTVYQLVETAIATGRQLAELVTATQSPESLEYDAVYELRSPWRLLPPIDHPEEPARCLVSGTGLTHKASAQNRQSMHTGATETAPVADEPLTDSMKMFRIGLEGGRPPAGQIGAAPEWFYKGSGTILRGHGEALEVPSHADDGGEEAEIAGAYLIGSNGRPYRIGMMQGNEFSDHVMESKNYLYLAPSKLRTCAVGPELVIDADFSNVAGDVRIQRGDSLVWQSELSSGEQAMSHSLANLEHHHFKHEAHRRPGDVHVHFFGADRFSFRDRVRLEDGDRVVISFRDFGRPLWNPVRIERSPATLVTVGVPGR